MELDGLLSVLFFLVHIGLILLIVGAFVAVLAGSIGEWNRNNHAPQQTVGAVVTGKRTHVTRYRNSSSHLSSKSTSYYVAFQTDNGEQMEFHVLSHAYHQLSEGDRGTLTFQGSRYIGFERV